MAHMQGVSCWPESLEIPPPECSHEVPELGRISGDAKPTKQEPCTSARASCCSPYKPHGTCRMYSGVLCTYTVDDQFHDQFTQRSSPDTSIGNSMPPMCVATCSSGDACSIPFSYPPCRQAGEPAGSEVVLPCKDVRGASCVHATRLYIQGYMLCVQHVTVPCQWPLLWTFMRRRSPVPP
jgi:hypothetical protein